MRTLWSKVILFAFAVMIFSCAASAQLRISVGFGPPAIPVYEQPVCPGDGYIWTPGYWAWDDSVQDYYWVPGTWVLAPEVGYLWTPPYWAWVDDGFVFYDGWWGPHVGFYGGINYGFGYFGVGFVGGRWDGGHFFYNHEVANINVTEIHNVYNERITNINENRVSYNGGNGGVVARATAEEESYGRERHIPPAAAQVQHMQTARGNPELRASANHGRPSIAATDRPGSFSGNGVVAAREAGAPYNPPANRGGARAENPGHPAVHPNDLPAIEHPAAPNTGNAELDKKYQQQQEQLQQRQQQDRQNLQQRQEQEHQQLDQQKANDQRRQQVEQKHQQQTQHLQQRQTQQTQHLQQRQASHSSAPRK